MSQKIIIVSNRLPITVEPTGLKASPGGLAKALASVFKDYNPTWVGWTGSKKLLTKSQIASLNFPKNLVPVNLSSAAIKGYYDKVSNCLLWPTLHEIKSAQISKEDWSVYRQVNRKFAEQIAKIAKPDDLIWIHDYHLFLLPTFLRDMGLKNKIGMFLHTPFCGPDYFLKIPYAVEILQSLTNVNLLGLQTKRDVENFNNCLKDKSLFVKDFPIGVDFKLFETASNKSNVKQKLVKLRQKYAGKKVILSISRLDYTKGIIEQILAADKVLRKDKNLHYVSVVAPSREGVMEYKNLKKQIFKLVESLDNKSIDLIYKNHDFDEVNALYLLSEVLLVTPFIDGMNLVAKEFVAAKTNGLMVLSKYAGAAFQLKDAILTDPYDIDEIALSLEEALDLSEDQKSARWQKMRINITDENVFWWAQNFLQTLKTID